MNCFESNSTFLFTTLDNDQALVTLYCRFHIYLLVGMEQKPRAQSIFEFLTHRNPHVHLSPESSSNTHNETYFWPRQIKKLEEFSFENLDNFYAGQLMHVARYTRDTLPPYPFILEKDRRISDEPTTANLISK
jgi:hypothetical protein